MKSLLTLIKEISDADGVDLTRYDVFVKEEGQADSEAEKVGEISPIGEPTEQLFENIEAAVGDIGYVVAVRDDGTVRKGEEKALAYRPSVTNLVVGDGSGEVEEGEEITISADVTISEGSFETPEARIDGGDWQPMSSAGGNEWTFQHTFPEQKDNVPVEVRAAESLQGLVGVGETTVNVVAQTVDITLLHDFDMAGSTLPLQDTVGTKELALDGNGLGSPTLEVEGSSRFSGVFGVRIEKQNEGLQATTYDATATANGIVLEVALDGSNGNNNGNILQGNNPGLFRFFKVGITGANRYFNISYRDVDGGSISSVDLFRIDSSGGNRARIMFLPNGEFYTQTYNFGDAVWNDWELRLTITDGADFFSEAQDHLHQGPRLDGGAGDDTDFIDVFDWKIYAVD